MAKKAKTKEKRGHLTRLQLVQLHNWLSKRKRQARSSSAPTLADLAAHELGFPVTVGQMQGMRMEMGLMGEKGHKSNCKHDGRAIRILARELVYIIELVGGTINRELQLLAK
jgi:hypothetical protein